MVSNIVTHPPMMTDVDIIGLVADGLIDPADLANAIEAKSQSDAEYDKANADVYAEWDITPQPGVKRGNDAPVSAQERAIVQNMLGANKTMTDRTLEEEERQLARLDELQIATDNTVRTNLVRAYHLGYSAGMSGSDRRESEAVTPLLEQIKELQGKLTSLDMEYCTLQGYSHEAHEDAASEKREVVEECEGLRSALFDTRETLNDALVLLNRLQGIMLSGKIGQDGRFSSPPKYLISVELANPVIEETSRFLFEHVERKENPNAQWEEMGS